MVELASAALLKNVVRDIYRESQVQNVKRIKLRVQLLRLLQWQQRAAFSGLCQTQSNGKKIFKHEHANVGSRTQFSSLKAFMSV